jgi:uncharacterized membrane protein YfcA
MDGATFELPLFLLATFAGAFVAGLSGFAFGLVAASVWLYVLTPLQSATLIVGFGLLVQGYSVWKLRGALNWSKLVPFIVGAIFGVPIGVVLLTWSDPRNVRIAVGIFLVAYSLYAFFRPNLKPVSAGGRCGRRRGGIYERRAWGPDRPGGHSCDDLVRVAWLAEGSSADDIPASCGRCLSFECALAWRERDYNGGDG